MGGVHNKMCSIFFFLINKGCIPRVPECTEVSFAYHISVKQTKIKGGNSGAGAARVDLGGAMCIHCGKERYLRRVHTFYSSTGVKCA